MPRLATAIKWTMLVSGVLTSTMVYAALAPAAALNTTFGESLEGKLAEIVVRNWGALIALVGGMLIYGAFRPAVQPMVLVVAGVSKLVFISLVVSMGSTYLNKAGPTIAIDSVMVVLFAVFLVASRRRAETVRA